MLLSPTVCYTKVKARCYYSAVPARAASFSVATVALVLVDPGVLLVRSKIRNKKNHKKFTTKNVEPCYLPHTKLRSQLTYLRTYQHAECSVCHSQINSVVYFADEIWNIIQQSHRKSKKPQAEL